MPTQQAAAACSLIYLRPYRDTASTRPSAARIAANPRISIFEQLMFLRTRSPNCISTNRQRIDTFPDSMAKTTDRVAAGTTAAAGSSFTKSQRDTMRRRTSSGSRGSGSCSSGAEECDHAKNFNQSCNLLAKQWLRIRLRQFEKRGDEHWKLQPRAHTHRLENYD
jgi:hypothetical protein